MSIVSKINFFRKGFTDSPANDDAFNISRYIDGLSNFISVCNTPMTISIQGDWGTGKTSIMKMVDQKFPDDGKIKKIWFNTWQYSQFNLSDTLPLLLVGQLQRKLSGESVALKELGSKFAESLLDVSMRMATSGAVGGKNITDIFTDGFFESFEKMRGRFQELVEKKAGPDGRVVIFIDDLDRLAPEKAVEILEVLKTFLDSEKCVFVLAIDYGVVIRGVKKKYGDDFGEEKGKSFFDKIIQVPFKMPVARYDISNYVKKCMQEVEIPIEGKVDEYVQLINCSVGGNPRAMKRLFNSYLMISNVVNLNDEKTKIIVFALICMQNSFEQIYDYIVRNIKTMSLEEFLKILDGTAECIEQLPESYQDQFSKFSDELFSILDADDSGDIDDKEFDKFKKIVNFSTSTSDDDMSPEAERWFYRNEHRRRCRNLLKKMHDLYGLEFKELYGRKANLGIGAIYIQPDKEIYGKKVKLELKMALLPSQNREYYSRAEIVLWCISRNLSVEQIKCLLDEDTFKLNGCEPSSYIDGKAAGVKGTFEFPTTASENKVRLMDKFINIFEKIKPQLFDNV